MHSKKFIFLTIIFLLVALGFASIIYTDQNKGVVSQEEEVPDYIKNQVKTPMPTFLIGEVVSIDEDEVVVRDVALADSEVGGNKMFTISSSTTVVIQRMEGKELLAVPATLSDVEVSKVVLILYATEGGALQATRIQILESQVPQ